VSHFNGKENIAYVTVFFPNKMLGHFNVNWMSPVKVRNTLIGGDKKMLVWNDLESDEKIKIYDKGVDVTTPESIYDLLISYRSGDVWAPKINQTEALKVEAEYFVDCVENNKTPFNDGMAGLRVVKILEATSKSLKSRGETILL
jgi:predicted dehydrogenase